MGCCLCLEIKYIISSNPLKKDVFLAAFVFIVSFPGSVWICECQEFSGCFWVKTCLRFMICFDNSVDLCLEVRPRKGFLKVHCGVMKVTFKHLRGGKN